VRAPQLALRMQRCQIASLSLRPATIATYAWLSVYAA